MQEEGESKVLPPSKRHRESICKSKERGSRTKKKEREQPKGSRLEKKKTTKREMYMEKTKKKE